MNVDGAVDLALLVTTVGTTDDAVRLARLLVAERLAACVTRLPAVHSVFRWDGHIEESDETVLFIKTVPERVDATRARLLELHPYELPEILHLPRVNATPAFAAWVRENVGPLEAR